MRLHASAEALHLAVEVLSGLVQDDAVVYRGMPSAVQAQGHLLHQIVDGVTFDVHRLIWVEVDAFFGNLQDFEVGATQARNGHEVVGPHGVSWEAKYVNVRMKLN